MPRSDRSNRLWVYGAIVTGILLGVDCVIAIAVPQPVTIGSSVVCLCNFLINLGMATRSEHKGPEY